MAQDANLQIRAIRENAHSTIGSRYDYDSLVEVAGNSRFALLGEASQGTHDFDHTRAQITQRLIEEKGYTAVAVEADWPDAYRVNRYVQGRGEDADAVEALGSFKRFPTWMWRNTDVVEFIAWLREYNDALPREGGKSASTVSICTVCMLLHGRCSTSWTRSILRRQGERAIAIPALNILARTRKRMDTQRVLGSARVVKKRPSTNSQKCRRAQANWPPRTANGSL